MYPTDYYTMIRSKNHIFDYRLHMVHSAITLGVKPTARIYKTSAPTVRKWRDRFEDEGSAGLRDRSRAPHSCPHKLPKEAEDTITTLRKRLPGFGAEHLKDEFDLPLGGLTPSPGLFDRTAKPGSKRKSTKKRTTCATSKPLISLLPTSRLISNTLLTYLTIGLLCSLWDYLASNTRSVNYQPEHNFSPMPMKFRRHTPY